MTDLIGPNPTGSARERLPADLSPLRPYEQQQGGYWLYGRHCDVHGNGRIWISAEQHERARRAALNGTQQPDGDTCRPAPVCPRCHRVYPCICPPKGAT